MTSKIEDLRPTNRQSLVTDKDLSHFAERLGESGTAFSRPVMQ